MRKATRCVRSRSCRCRTSSRSSSRSAQPVGLGCKIETKLEHTFVGTAYEIADLDRDGKLELASAGAVAPGEPDVLRIVTLGEDEKKPAMKKGVSGGGIAGIVYADIDGTAARSSCLRCASPVRPSSTCGDSSEACGARGPRVQCARAW